MGSGQRSNVGVFLRRAEASQNTTSRDMEVRVGGRGVRVGVRNDGRW